MRKTGVKEGICFVFVPHTTAAITINENADPSVTQDILNELSKIVPPMIGITIWKEILRPTSRQAF